MTWWEVGATNVTAMVAALRRRGYRAKVYSPESPYPPGPPTCVRTNAPRETVLEVREEIRAVVKST